MTGITDAVAESIAEASTVLLVAPPDSSTDSTACTDLLTRHSPPHPNVVCVTVNKGPDDRIDVWQQYVGEELPARAAIVDARPGDDSEAQSAITAAPSVKLETLAADGDLLDLAVTIAAQIGAWVDTGDPTQLCLDSLDTLLDRYTVQDVVDLARGLNTLCVDLGVFAHHHVDPTDCPDSMIAALRPLYDAVVERDGDGWTVSTAGDAEVEPSFRGTVGGRSSPSTDNGAGRSFRGSDPADVTPLPQSFDTVLELFDNPFRRSVLYELRGRGGDDIPLAELIGAVRGRTNRLRSIDPDGIDRIAVRLRHAHLPKLEAANVIEYDRDAETVSYRANPALEAHIDYLETLELG